MENSKITLKQIISDDVKSIDKIKCSKCGGAGNFKTHENSRRTCLVCFGRGYINICLLYTSPSPRDKRQSRMPSSA